MTNKRLESGVPMYKFGNIYPLSRDPYVEHSEFLFLTLSNLPKVALSLVTISFALKAYKQIKTC